MRTCIIVAGLGGAMLLAGQAVGADNEAGVPLTPAEAAGGWTLSQDNRPVCTLTLGARHTVRAGGDCAAALSGQPTGWAPTSDGMRLTGADGQTIVSFGRWSNSLFVSHVSSGRDLQLRRGG
ncbi:MAG TPA: AprI/Inh family metalloprotease inhibitor [Caulobacteraceae bacterium]|jgi:hypothetical protein|nr:AprI/Inh family metalloprotease inhibitor [Caulobacteraceae bacterium]